MIGEGRKGHVYYRCHTSTCRETGLREERIAEFVENRIKPLDFSGRVKAMFQAGIEQLKQRWITEKEQHFAACRVKLEQIAERLRRLTDAYLDQVIDRDTFEERKQNLLLERRSAEDTLSAVQDNPEGLPAMLEKFVGLAGSMYTAYKAAHPEKRRWLIQTVMSDFTAERKTLDLTYAPVFQHLLAYQPCTTGGPRRVNARTFKALIAALSERAEECALIVKKFEDEACEDEPDKMNSGPFSFQKDVGRGRPFSANLDAD